MSLLTTKGVYGLAATIEIAKASRQNPVPLTLLSGQIGVSKNYLEQILNTLRAAGVVASIKGAKGGYFLNKSPDELTLMEILSPLENSFGLANTELKNSAYNAFFESLNKQLLATFSQTLSKSGALDLAAKSYLNYVI